MVIMVITIERFLQNINIQVIQIDQEVTMFIMIIDTLLIIEVIEIVTKVGGCTKPIKPKLKSIDLSLQELMTACLIQNGVLKSIQQL